jgi:uncharacterized glyoxalase superfamily protein PhnB
MADVKPVLNAINLVARDFDATLAFYRRLGLEIPDGRHPEDTRHAKAELSGSVDLELDNERLARFYNAAWRRPGGSSRAVIGFTLPTREAVDESYADLVAAGYEGRQPPYDTFWGARYAIVADPDGNDVGLMSPSDPARRYWPPKDSPAS